MSQEIFKICNLKDNKINRMDIFNGNTEYINQNISNLYSSNPNIFNNILTEDEESSKRQEDFSNKTKIFVQSLDVDETLAQLLVSEGFSSVEEVIETEISELLSIEGFDEEIASELIERAKKYLFDKDQENQSKIEKMGVSKDLTQFDLLTKSMVVKLAENNIKLHPCLIFVEISFTLCAEPIISKLDFLNDNVFRDLLKAER